jgi:hypothetical protein
MAEDKTSTFEEYINFVRDIIAKYKGIGDLVLPNETEVTPRRLNAALVDYYSTCTGLNAEYQRAKMEHISAKNSFDRWWDKIFIDAKKRVIADYTREDVKGVKPSVTEFETRARLDSADEYYGMKERLDALEARSHFLLRMLETLASYDKILVTLSSNLRQEMYSISIDRRACADPLKQKVRRIE